MGVLNPGKVKFPFITNHFAKCDHKGELSAVLSAIYYLKGKILGGVYGEKCMVEITCLNDNVDHFST